MQAVRQATQHLPAGTVHFEYFSAPPATEAAPAAGFEVELRRSGRRLEVPAGQSILEALEANGIDHPFSCREGLCRTCETRVCAGEVDHRDFALSEAEQAAGEVMLICVSRARSERLVLDL
jgi:vanillate O-demethylase ferredoxin subunit